MPIHIDLFDRGVLTNVVHHPARGYQITLVPDGGEHITLDVDWRVLDQLARQSAEIRPPADGLPGIDPGPVPSDDLLDRLRTGYAEAQQ